ncbi:Hypothetical predicted protein [Octopus vulgaris]|uniref:DUF4371 domain-containing protein n=1 Tax=Octopus vulgaris TaxID=6645 RepID=A0AA36ARI0_OCTVU|nr:Hypothetical predicted protein [Octopus vulgaris]
MTKMESQLDTASIFTGLSNRIQNDLIEAIHKDMLNEMQKEIEQAKFVSILVDETSDVSASSQLSTVLRYVTEDCVTKERFIGFSDVSADRSANALSEYVFKCIETWECGNKWIAQTYDGVATMAGQLNKLQAKVSYHTSFNSVFKEHLTDQQKIASSPQSVAVDIVVIVEVFAVIVAFAVVVSMPVAAVVVIVAVGVTVAVTAVAVVSVAIVVVLIFV